MNESAPTPYLSDKTTSDLLQSALRAARMGVWQWNVLTGEVLWRGNVEAIFGLALGEFTGDLASVMNFTHPDDRETVSRQIASVMQRSISNIHFEHRIVWRDGSIHWIEGEGEVDRNSEGTPLRMTGTVVEVTKRKQAEETIFNIERGVVAATGETFFRSLTQHLARVIPVDMTFVGRLSADSDRRIATIAVFADGRPGENFEYELLNAPCENVLKGGICCYPSGVQKQFPLDKSLAKMQAEAYVGTPLIDSSGHTLGLLSAISKKPLEHPELAKSKLQIFAVRAAAELERTIAEQALRESEERFRRIFENAPIGMANVDTDLRMVKVNEALCRMLGYTQEELTGRTFPEVTFPDDIDKDVQLAQKLIRGDIPSYELEKRYLKKNGEIMWGFLTAALFRDKDGNPSYLLGMLEDISERKQMEEQLRQSQKMEAIGQLAGGIAHDFNNLLTVINGYSDLSLALLKENDPIHRKITEVRRAGDQAASLTRQLLAFSRKQMLQLKIIDLNTVMSDLETMLHRLIGEDIKLKTVHGSQLKTVLADRGQLEQVILNLAVNSRDAMPNGGRLTIETSNVYLDDNYASHHVSIKPGHYVRLIVTDTGEGIPPEIQQRIFDPFFTTKKVGKGTGLGLSTVYGIVKQTGGSISVSSEVDRGTTFTIYLPAVKEGITRHDHATGSFKGPWGTGTILLAEDENVVRKLIRVTLEHSGYKVLEASNGAAALQICKEYTEPIDLLLTDVVMPEMSGHELAQEFSAMKPGTRILFMSGYTDDAVLQHGIVNEEVEFIQKPFTPASLISKVKEILSAQPDVK